MLKFDRLQVLINLLQSRPGIKAPELAKETGVCERTIYRDLLWLESQYPVIHNHGYSLAPAYRLKPLTFTKAEYNVLQLALSSPALFRSDLKPILCSLKAKIDTVVDPSVRNCSIKIDQFAPVLIESCSDTQRMATFSGILQQAITCCRAVDIDYLKDGMEECERVFPHYLVYSQPDWVLVGLVKSRKVFDAVSTSRIREISLTTQTFQRDTSFSLEKFFLSRWKMKGGIETTVRVRFTGAAAKIILSQKHHPKEEVVKVDDGEVLYTLTVCGIEEIMRWILGFGSDAEVLAPKSLREQIEQHIKCLAGVYRNKPKIARRQPRT